MTAYKSTQETKRTAHPVKALSTTELKGRVRIAHFDYTVPAGTIAVDDTVDLTQLPQGARVIGGMACWTAMSTDAGTAQVQIGDATTPTKFLSTTSVDATGSTTFADTIARNYGALMSDDTVIRATVKGEAWAADAVLKGHILYVLD